MKYELGQVIFYLHNGKIHSAPVVSRMCIENAHESRWSTPEQHVVWEQFGAGGVWYATVNGVLAENEAFATKEELVAQLIASLGE